MVAAGAKAQPLLVVIAEAGVYAEMYSFVCWAGVQLDFMNQKCMRCLLDCKSRMKE